MRRPPCDPRADAIAALDAAWRELPAGQRQFFGLSTSEQPKGILFEWRNYATGERGPLSVVPPQDASSFAAIVGRLAELRQPAQKKSVGRETALRVVGGRRRG